MSLESAKQNKGFLIPLAAIIIVGVAILAAAISRFTSQSSQASVLEGISIQAFYAAESGANVAMNQLMFNVDDRSTADANCDALSGRVVNFSTAGLQVCQAIISCSRSNIVGSPQSFYNISSSGTCGSGDIFARRIIEVSSFM